MDNLVERLRAYRPFCFAGGQPFGPPICDEAAAEIEALRKRVEELEDGLFAIRQSGIERETKWFGMNAHDIARATLAQPKEEGEE